MKSKAIFILFLIVACSSFIANQEKPIQDERQGDFLLIDNSNLDTLILVFHGSYNYDYYRVFVNGFLFDDGLLYSMDGREIPHRSVNIIYDSIEMTKELKVTVEVNRRSEGLSGSYTPLWGEMDISQTVFKNPPYKATLKLDSIGNQRVYKVSNSGGKLNITPLIKGSIWD